MKHYLRWAQVQEHLKEHYEATHEPFGFFEAVKELWEEGRFQCAEELPSVPFSQWDDTDLDELERLLDQLPVDLNVFYRDFTQGSTPQNSTQQLDALDITPIRIARYQAQGVHWHDSFEVDYVAKGAARLFCGGTICSLSAGTLCLISPRVPHDAVSGEDCILLSVSLSERTIEETLFRLLRQESVIADFFRFGLQSPSGGYMIFRDLAQRDMLPLFRNIFHECYSARDYYQAACADYIELMFVYLLRHGGQWYGRSGPGPDGGRIFPTLAVLKYLQTNYRTTNLRETAAAFHYEPDYLSKQLRLHAGKNYSQLLNQLRLDAARRLLRTTDLSVERVAGESGFHSQLHLTRAFRRYEGTTPGAWREEHRKKDGR